MKALQILLLVIGGSILLLPIAASAAPCGGATPCACFDTVTSDYVMAADLSCDYGPVINTDNVVFDCNYHKISPLGAGIFALGVEASNVIVRNCIIDDYNEGMYSFFEENITIRDTNISNCNYGVSTVSVDNLTIRNITMENINIKSFLFNLSTNASFYDNDEITEYLFENSIVELETSDAAIELTETVLSSGSNLSAVIIVKPNNITINTNIDPNFNKPAKLTLYNIAYTQPKILRDGADCLEPNCYILSYDEANDILKFNVTGFSSYSAGEGFTGGAVSAPGFEPGLLGILFAVLLVGLMTVASVTGFYIRK